VHTLPPLSFVVAALTWSARAHGELKTQSRKADSEPLRGTHL